VVLVLDGKTIDVDALKVPLALKPGDHELEIRRPGKEPEVRKFRVAPEDDGGQVFVPPPEPAGDVRLVQQFKVPLHSVWSLGFMPDGRVVTFADPIHLFDRDREAEEKRLRIKGIQVVRGAAFPDNRRLLAIGKQNTQQVALILSAEDGTILRKIDGARGQDPARWPSAAAVSADGTRFLVNFDDDLIRVFHADRDEAELRVEGHVACFSRDGTRILTAVKKTILLFDAKDGKELRRFDGHENVITSVALTPDGRRAISASRDRTVRVWDLETGKELHKLEGHTGHVYGVAVSPDGRRILSTGYTQDKTVRLWDLASGKLLHVFEPQQPQIAVAFSPGGKFGLSGGPMSVWLWQLPP
jgi:WD40 repeat protein